MKHLYFVRHGESEMNTQNVFSGHTDTPLTHKGRQQALETGSKLRDQQVNVDLIVASPLQRAHHTAIHIAETIGYEPEKIILHDLLRERYFGEVEGQGLHPDVNEKYQKD